MKEILRTLFDYQKFEENAAMQRVIDTVHARYSVRELDLDEMEMVAAAGIAEAKSDQNTRSGGSDDVCGH